ncbi:hypothetical protein ACFOEE_03980 [Pseudoalteromonas fenneropenaei]|uniref:Uncharacterized protein n=1 Tax=Pseudoalteromonas fenneropenaei TaxID=1737459 RepID=A0ABV7CGE7_9GAMM
MYTSDDIYIWFRDRLKSKLETISLSDFAIGWSTGLANKTKFYEQLFKEVGEFERKVVTYEQFRCDVTISDENGVPLVLIEMENAHSTASSEIEQLCCLNAPLKVLVISCAWHDSERERWLPIWQNIIRKHNSAFPTNSKFCIVVGEWGRGRPCDELLRYYMVTLSSQGNVVEDLVWQLQKTE